MFGGRGRGAELSLWTRLGPGTAVIPLESGQAAELLGLDGEPRWLQGRGGEFRRGAKGPGAQRRVAEGVWRERSWQS